MLNLKDTAEPRSYSLISDVVEAATLHVKPLNAQQEIRTAAQAGALGQGRVVDDGPLSRALQLLPALRRSRSPLRPGKDAH